MNQNSCMTLNRKISALNIVNFSGLLLDHFMDFPCKQKIKDNK